MPAFGGGDDHRALAETDRRDEIDQPDREILAVGRVLQRNALVGIDRRQILEGLAPRSLIGRQIVDLIDIHQRAVAVAVARGARLAGNIVAIFQRKAADLRD